MDQIRRSNSAEMTPPAPIPYTDSHILANPLLPPARPRRSSFSAALGTPTSKALRRLRRAIVLQMLRCRTQRVGLILPPQISAAREYMRFFLPKTNDGKLLSLRCSESEFTSHVGSGVSIYMHFVKMTGWLFVIGTILAIPQFVANSSGRGFRLNWPWASADCDNTSLAGKSGIMRLVSQLMSTFGWLFFSWMLGNVTFSAGSSDGWLHLVSEMLLSTVFCVYVYWMWRYCSQTLEEMDTSRTRASDFAVAVRRLPLDGTDVRSVKNHFTFFGKVASVALSLGNDQLLSLLREQHALRSKWRRVHTQYARTMRASSRGRPPAKLLQEAEGTLSKLAACQVQIQQARRFAGRCTGHAFVVFEKKKDAAKCVRHFELIRQHERSREGVSGASVDFRQLYFRTHKLDVERAPEPSVCPPVKAYVLGDLAHRALCAWRARRSPAQRGTRWASFGRHAMTVVK